MVVAKTMRLGTNVIRLLAVVFCSTLAILFPYFPYDIFD
jgi:hypothetical protein